MGSALYSTSRPISMNRDDRVSVWIVAMTYILKIDRNRDSCRKVLTSCDRIHQPEIVPLL